MKFEIDPILIQVMLMTYVDDDAAETRNVKLINMN